MYELLIIYLFFLKHLFYHWAFLFVIVTSNNT